MSARLAPWNPGTSADELVERADRAVELLRSEDIEPTAAVAMVVWPPTWVVSRDDEPGDPGEVSA